MADDDFAFLNDREFQAALAELEEATRIAKGKRRIEPTTRRLELAARKFFREQGSRFLRKFRSEMRSRFSEGFEGHAAFLDTPLQESLTPAEWLVIWYEVTQATDDLLAGQIDQAVQRTLLAGAMNAIMDMGLRISFSLSNPQAEAYLQKYGAKLVTKIDEETRSQLQTILNDAIANGWSYDKTAETITAKFEQFAVGNPLEHIDSRAHLVAVTETGNAYAEGNLIMIRNLQAAGIKMEKSWSTVGDERVSTGCLENQDAGWVGVEQAFPSGHQRPLRFPGCRCDLLYRRTPQG
jgi:hypothetical protein